jgi:hypothetical protein
MIESLDLTRIDDDVNGNGRYVVHFLQLNTREELDKQGDEWIPIAEKYALACERARAIGGKRYRAKSYGGGIVFQECSVDVLALHISRVTGRSFSTD